MREKTQKIVNRAILVIGSKCFTWCVIAFFVLQSLWLAFSFRFPLAYDEIFHFPVIKIYANQLSPFILDQPAQYDRYGDLSSGGATIFHYLMSFPLRLISSITDDQTIQILVLRTICIGMVAVGLYLFYRLFRNINVSPAVINTGLLLTVLLPIFIMTSATINYDNLLFPLTAWYLLICTRIILDKNLNWLNYAGLLGVGLLALSTKTTFLPIFAASVIYITATAYRRLGKEFVGLFWKSVVSAKIVVIIAVLVAFLSLLGLFSFRYVHNYVEFHTISPSCVKTLGLERCKTNQVFKRDLDAQTTSATKVAVPIYEYTMQWYESMSIGSVISAGVPANGVLRKGPPLPVMAVVLFFGIFFSLAAILYSWTSVFRRQEWRFLIFISSVLILTVFLYNAKSYYAVHSAFAMQPRYMLSIVPIILVATVASFSFMLRNSKTMKLNLLFCGILILTQGGGLITHIVRSDESWNWDSQVVRQLNNKARSVLQPLVKEQWYDK